MMDGSIILHQSVYMWKSPEKRALGVPGWGVVALTLGVIALITSLGVARWSWFILDEQVRLREDFMDLKLRQEQVEVQYEFWLDELRDERKALRESAE